MYPIARIALKSTTCALLKEYHRPQASTYISRHAAQWIRGVFVERQFRIIRFSPNCVVKPQDVFIDIGANMGRCCTAAIRTPRVKVLAMEPIGARRNISVRNLSDPVSPARFRVIRNPSTKRSRQSFQSRPCRTYATVILDAIQSRKPDILKLDGSHMKLLDHRFTPPMLSKIRIFIIDTPPHLYDGNARSSPFL